ncbi:MAG TPA: LysR family transcriptional regulator [Bordetella sp.]
MINLNEFATFCAIADTGSFSQAAEKLQISKALVTKHLLDLEQSLGVKLVHRTTRKVGLTAAGAIFHQRCRRLLEDAGGMVEEIKRFRTSLGGHVKVSAAIAFGRLHLAPLIARFLQQYPDVSVELTLTDRFADLITEGQDVVIRAAQEPRLSSLVARRLAPWRWVLCAAPSYLARHPAPHVPRDLAGHNCLLYSSNTRGEWKFTHAEGAETVRVKGNFKANNADGVLQGTLAGLGIAAITTMAAADEIRAGRLVRLLPDYLLPEGMLYASYLPNPTMAQCVQTFVHFLEAEFANQAPWERGLDFPRWESPAAA